MVRPPTYQDQYLDTVPYEPQAPDDHTTGQANGNGNGHHPVLDEVIPPLKVFSVVELLQEEFEPLKWIIPDILPEGLTLLFSRPKIGKSMLALALSLRMARRVSGGIDGETLYLTLDDTSKRRLQSRTRSLLQGAKVEDRLWFATEARSLDKGLPIQLGYWMNAHPDTSLVVIDVYGTIKPKRQGDDIYKNDYDALASLRDFAEKHHIAILLVHHTKKQVDSEDWINNVNGSTGLIGAVDTIWMLKRRRGSQQLELYTTGRDVEDSTIELSLDDLDAPWKVQGQEDEPEANTAEQKILDALHNAGEALPPKLIAELTELKLLTVRGTIRRMLSKKSVFQTSYGLYQELQSYRVTKNDTIAKVVTLDSETKQEPAIEAASQKSYKELQRVTSDYTPSTLESDKPAIEAASQKSYKELQNSKLTCYKPSEHIKMWMGEYPNQHCPMCESSSLEPPIDSEMTVRRVPHCKLFSCLNGPNRTQRRLSGDYCPVHKGYIDEKGMPL